MNRANLTRFGPQVVGTQAVGHEFSASFKALDASAILRLEAESYDRVRILLNDQVVLESGQVQSAEKVELAVQLQRENTIAIQAQDEINVRVTQMAEADLGLLNQGYFGLNTSDMERQRGFYRTLGFEGEFYPAGPETSTTFARALGFEDDYLIHVSLHSLVSPPVPPFVDTVQFRGESFRPEPPYAHLNHVGMAYATYACADIEADYHYLKSQGVDFVSPPATAPNGERFVFFKEPDGAFIKLVHSDTEAPPATPPNLLRLENTNMNVTDLERSREFYRLLGFTESKPAAQAGDGAFAEAHGFTGHIEFEGEDISLGAGTDGATLQLRQWRQPYDHAPPYPPPVNHLGIDRINFYVKDLTAVVKTMNDLGFDQLGPIGGAPEIGIVFFFDPDGIKVQFAGPQTG